ncbi:undecaprenyl-diphosphatase UppP [Candidatus Gottesmanbacteria bacterium]|nr:undecaprenyl-diphosphatase UppP [Candidatus Gottesmanbacteria bacterium]
MTYILYAVLFGVVQGLTEFLPISSTGHLILLEKFFKLPPETFGLSFDIALHIGTLLALLIYFRKDVIAIIYNMVSRKDNLGIKLLIATIPAIFAGLVFEKLIRADFRSPILMAVNLFIFSFVFLIAEKLDKNNNKVDNISFKQSFVIGIYQAIALLPGVSRSGITISGGLFSGLTKEDAGRFAFLLSIPIIALASIADLPHLISGEFNSQTLGVFTVGMLSAFVTGYFCIKYFLIYLKKHGFVPFVVYRIILAVLILLYFK